MTTHFHNPYLPHSLRDDVPPAAPRRSAPLTLDPAGLPVGTAAQVLQWVDDDPDRAQAFLNKEQRETRPRITLVSNLKAVLKRHEIVPVSAPAPAPLTAVPTDFVDDETNLNQLDMIRERLKVVSS